MKACYLTETKNTIITQQFSYWPLYHARLPITARVNQRLDNYLQL